jgi:tRNA nucleotidyltransferase/poly(A) polymerase
MKLRDLLNLIQKVSSNTGIKQTWICGGTPRDRVLGLIKNEIVDLDITTGDKKIHYLSKELELELKKVYSIKCKSLDDGHSSLIFTGNDFKIDFSSNFTNKNIDKHLLVKGIKNPTDLQREMFSRDFTCNALLLTIDLKKITDPTYKGLEDIKKRVLNTCLEPNITLHDSPNRIIRTVYLSSKLDFDVPKEIVDWIIKHKDILRMENDKYLIKNINKAMEKNPERAVYLINKMDLWDILPITDSLRPYYNKKRVMKAGQIKRNTDYGESLYSNMDKYKSVLDFRKKRRKKRMKILKNIKNMKTK